MVKKYYSHEICQADASIENNVKLGETAAEPPLTSKNPLFFFKKVAQLFVQNTNIIGI